jgi:hypothetical protein
LVTKLTLVLYKVSDMALLLLGRVGFKMWWVGIIYTLHSSVFLGVAKRTLPERQDLRSNFTYLANRGQVSGLHHALLSVGIYIFELNL